MSKSSFLLLVDIFVILMLCISLCHGAVDDDRKVYIAYLGSAPDRDYIATSQHSTMLQALSTHSLRSGAIHEDRKTTIFKNVYMELVYIAYLGPLPDGDYIASSHLSNMLQALSKHR
ncbi:hypothetical protein PVK06_025646 [Gossypium arboreum]|uniref:Inhibitor I9 domain-containing protein n=1 Tax=Gossypium arboreum TaxID=29729 RepID=A0ABR0NVK3_GOSAR|nr:hypothetical protein PVK06_025646 [Gossypium arboreum]